MRKACAYKQAVTVIFNIEGYLFQNFIQNNVNIIEMKMHSNAFLTIKPNNDS